jgi:uncharacterized RDD family membrane protein YckC
MTAATVPARECPRCHRPTYEGLFCQFDGTFLLDQEGTVIMATRLSRIGSWLVNILLVFLTLFIGWFIWWFIVAPKGQNPGKAVVGLRVIKTDGSAMNTGSMFVRGLIGIVCGFIPLYLDNLWMLWDKDAQTLHDKLADTVVVKAAGSEKIVERGSLGPVPPGYERPAFAPPVSFPSTPASPPPAPVSPDTAEALRQLDELRAKNLVTDEEYQAKRKAIMDRL